MSLVDSLYTFNINCSFYVMFVTRFQEAHENHVDFYVPVLGGTSQLPEKALAPFYFFGGSERALP